MTGYGKSIADIPGKKITIEVKSLNSRSLDINTRLPWLYKEKEPEIRNLVSQKLDRGKIDIFINFDLLDSEVIPVINKAIVDDYYRQIKEIAAGLNITVDNDILPAILRLPDALKTEKPELTDEEWVVVSENIIEALDQVDTFRTGEGDVIEKDIKSCISNILGLLDEIEPYEGERIKRIREKLNLSLLEIPGNNNIDENRFEQELIYYLEKLDINEEKVRLRKHCEYFLEKLLSSPPNGKILGFIAQEIGREINTIGSKANDATIQKKVVMMKDELEKIKEQSLNVL